MDTFTKKITELNELLFLKKTEHHDILNELLYDKGKMLKEIENTCQLINIEYLNK